MKFKSICLSSMLIYGLYAGTAYPEAVLTSKAYVDNKVPAYNSSTESQSLLADTTTTGTIAKRAIYSDTAANYDSTTQSTQIPTMGAVMSAITANSIPDTFEWNTTNLTAAGRYSTDFDGTYGNYPVADATKLVNGTAFATGLSMKQNRINGHAANAADSLLTDSDTNGTVQKRAIFNDTAANYDSTTQSTQIPTMGAVMSAVSSGVSAGLPTGPSGSIATYQAGANNTGVIGGSVAILDMDTYDASLSHGDLIDNPYKDLIPDAGTVGSAIAEVAIPASTNGYIATHSGTEGTFGTPVNPATFQSAITAHAANAADSLLTDSDTNGTVQKRAIFNDTAANYDSTTQSTQIPTMGAVMSAVSAGTNAVDVSSHTVNGAPLSNSTSYFYGTSSTAAATVQKEVSIPSITSLQTGQIIVVKPTVTSSVANSTLKLNNFDAYPMRYNNAAITTSSDSIVWNASYPSIWVFDGTYWVFLGHGLDSNTTYDPMSVEEGTTGTATAKRVLQAANLKQIIQGTTLTELSTSDATAVVATDSITTGIGKLQAQITNVAGDIPTLPTGTADSLVTYGANGTFGERGVEATALGTSTSATTVPTTGVVVSAFNTKFPANGGTDKVVTLSSTAGAPSSRNIVTTLTNGGTNIPTDGAVYSAVNGKQDKATCTEYKAGSNNTICYAYTFTDISAGSDQSKGTPEIEPELKKQ